MDEKVKNALHAVQLDDFAQRYPHQLSGGQQQRVAFARAIVIEPVSYTHLLFWLYWTLPAAFYMQRRFRAIHKKPHIKKLPV